MPSSPYAELFHAESREHVAAVNRCLLALEATPSAREPVEGVFRAVHTIKGMAASMGYADLAGLAHEMENVLEPLRQGRSAADPELIEQLFRATDVLEAAITAVAGGDADPGPAARVAAMCERLRARTAALTDAPPPPEHAGGAPAMHVELSISPGEPLPGVRAFLALQRARELGEVSRAAPPEAELTADTFAGRLRFVLHTALSPAEVERRLRAVGELAKLDVRPLGSGNGTGAAAADGQATADPPPPAKFAVDRHVRVEATRLDRLMDRVGELMILRDRLLRVAAPHRDPALLEPLEQAGRLIAELRDEVLSIRMVPVGTVFDRFPRLVRDAARALGKQVELVVEGAEIELDRALLDGIADPLVHLLRNAVSHGIETPAERRTAGKPPTGRLRLAARRERTRVLVCVEDDGRGIDRGRVARRAVELGLVEPEVAAELGDDELFRLVTRPGFSTAEAVTDVSGRGVGLDVVATRVRALGGTLDIVSRAGEGTSFVLRLPLSVGIQRTLLVRAGGHTYALPVAHVAETLELVPAAVGTAGGRRIAILRDEPVPLFSLARALGAPAPPASPPTSDAPVPVVLLEIGEQEVALEVEALLGQQEIVVKPFDSPRGTLPVFSGATILSDGAPALILDVASLVRAMSAAEPRAAGTRPGASHASTGPGLRTGARPPSDL